MPTRCSKKMVSIAILRSKLTSLFIVVNYPSNMVNEVTGMCQQLNVVKYALQN